MFTSLRSSRFLLVALFFALGAGIFVARASAQDQSWQVLRADYGYKSYRVDVTELVVDLISRGGVNGRISVDNQTMGGDPAVGKDKSLRIFARNRKNQEREFDYNEGGSFDAPLFTVSSHDWDNHGRNDGPYDHDRNDRKGFWIIRGFYGVQGRTADVTGILQDMVREHSLVVDVDNRSLGGDPAPGADKILIVIYMNQGQEQATAVRESRTLSIP